jgi:alpha-tubulin suppressor-like RCC1 family protein
VDRNSQVACWGHGAQGQLGCGLSEDRPKPEAVKPYMGSEALDQIAEVQLGASFSCALSSRGAVFCWGDDGADQLGQRMERERDMKPPPPGFAQQVPRFGRQR